MIKMRKFILVLIISFIILSISGLFSIIEASLLYKSPKNAEEMKYCEDTYNGLTRNTVESASTQYRMLEKEYEAKKENVDKTEKDQLKASEEQEEKDIQDARTWADEEANKQFGGTANYDYCLTLGGSQQKACQEIVIQHNTMVEKAKDDRENRDDQIRAEADTIRSAKTLRDMEGFADRERAINQWRSKILREAGDELTSQRNNYSWNTYYYNTGKQSPNDPRDPKEIPPNPKITPALTPTPTPTGKPALTPTPTQTPTGKPTLTSTPTQTPTFTPTGKPGETARVTPTGPAQQQTTTVINAVSNLEQSTKDDLKNFLVNASGSDLSNVVISKGVFKYAPSLSKNTEIVKISQGNLASFVEAFYGYFGITPTAASVAWYSGNLYQKFGPTGQAQVNPVITALFNAYGDAPFKDIQTLKLYVNNISQGKVPLAGITPSGPSIPFEPVKPTEPITIPGSGEIPVVVAPSPVSPVTTIGGITLTREQLNTTVNVINNVINSGAITAVGSTGAVGIVTNFADVDVTATSPTGVGTGTTYTPPGAAVSPVYSPDGTVIGGVNSTDAAQLTTVAPKADIGHEASGVLLAPDLGAKTIEAPKVSPEPDTTIRVIKPGELDSTIGK